MADAVLKIDRSHTFPNGALVSVFISGTKDELLAHRIDWHGERPMVADEEREAFWDEFQKFYAEVISEAQKHISPAAMHSDEGLAILFPDRVYRLGNPPYSGTKL